MTETKRQLLRTIRRLRKTGYDYLQIEAMIKIGILATNKNVDAKQLEREFELKEKTMREEHDLAKKQIKADEADLIQRIEDGNLLRAKKKTWPYKVKRFFWRYF